MLMTVYSPRAIWYALSKIYRQQNNIHKSNCPILRDPSVLGFYITRHFGQLYKYSNISIYFLPLKIQLEHAICLYSEYNVFLSSCHWQLDRKTLPQNTSCIER